MNYLNFNNILRLAVTISIVAAVLICGCATTGMDLNSASGQVRQEAQSNGHAADGNAKRVVAVPDRHRQKYEHLERHYASFITHADALLINRMGAARLDEGDAPAAIWFFGKAIEKDPSRAQSYYNRGVCLELQEDYRQALLDFNDAIERDPDFSSAYAHLGLIYTFHLNFVDARANIDKAIQTDAKNGLAYQSKAVMLYQLGKYEESWANVIKAQDLDFQVNPALIRALNLHL